MSMPEMHREGDSKEQGAYQYSDELWKMNCRSYMSFSKFENFLQIDDSMDCHSPKHTIDSPSVSIADSPAILSTF